MLFEENSNEPILGTRKLFIHCQEIQLIDITLDVFIIRGGPKVNDKLSNFSKEGTLLKITDLLSYFNNR